MTPETRDWIDVALKAVIAVVAICSLLNSLRNSRAIEVVRKDVNGEAASRLKDAKKASHAEGVLEEKERQI